MYMVRSKDTPHKDKCELPRHMALTTFIRKKEYDVLGFSRSMAPAAFVTLWQALLVRDPGLANRVPGAPAHIREQADDILQANAILPAWRTARSAFRDGDPPPALCTW